MNEYSPPKFVTGLTSWKVGQLGGLCREAVSDALRGEGLRRNHSTILAKLVESPGMSQAELSRQLWIDPSDLHAALNDLEQRGFVKRVADAADRRRKLVELLPAGRSAQLRLQDAIEQAQAAILEPLSASERTVFNATIDKLLDGRWPPEDH